MKKDKKNPLGASFGYAFEGILTGIRKERNMKIHCLAIVAVTCAGTLFHITPVEWCICLLLFAAIISVIIGLIIFLPYVLELLRKM